MKACAVTTIKSDKCSFMSATPDITQKNETLHRIILVVCDAHTPSLISLWEGNSPLIKVHYSVPKVQALKFDAKQQNEFRHYTDNMFQSRIFTHKLSLTRKAVNFVFNVSHITDSYKVYANLYRMIGNLWALKSIFSKS